MQGELHQGTGVSGAPWIGHRGPGTRVPRTAFGIGVHFEEYSAGVEVGSMADLKLRVNGSERTAQAAEDEPMLWVLRNKLGLTGTKYGCGEGQCGACTVLLDGRATRSCLTPAGAATGARITTVEGLEQHGLLTPVQQAFLEEGAFQCGYCTSGMVMAATALLAEHAHPSETEIVEGMNGNVCRCGTYPRIVAAIRRAAHTAVKKEADYARG